MKRLTQTLFLAFILLTFTEIGTAQTRPRRVQPPVAETPPLSSPASPETNAISAEAGDTLNLIARRLKIPVEKLLNVNGYLPDEPLAKGERINLPTSSSSAQQPEQADTSPEPAPRKTRKTTSGKKRKPGSYTNVDGERVRRPTASSSAPDGASAQCRDGTYSFSRHRRGTCSHHGGVARWL
ncbi:MAG: DUF3761 domain-containing protein [Acidobacteria bacterium]|nr:DUF3761 domain-containing protein [Acidobacteriota bacterium]